MTVRTARFKRRPGRRGVSTVEFAVTLPFLFLMFFSALEFGRAQTVKHSVHNAAYEGARRGVVPGATEAQITAAVNAVLDTIQAENTDITVRQNTDFVTVTVSLPFEDQAWFSPLYFRNMDLASTVTLSKDKM